MAKNKLTETKALEESKAPKIKEPEHEKIEDCLKRYKRKLRRL